MFRTQPQIVFAVVGIVGACCHQSLAQGQRQLGALTIDLPMTDTSVCSDATSWGTAAKIPVIVECTKPGVKGEPPPRQRVFQQLDLSNLSPSASIDLMRHQLATYKIEYDGRVAVFRPKRNGVTDPPSMLDTVVPIFTLRDASAVDAATAINRIFDPTYLASDTPMDPKRGHYMTDDPRARALADEAAKKYNTRFDKFLTLEIADSTVEGVLKAIALKTGFSWRVVYVRPTRQYTDSFMELLTGSAPIRTTGVPGVRW